VKPRVWLALALAALASQPAQAARRTPKRVPPTQAPTAGWCPLYRGLSGGQPLQASTGGQLLFTAAATTQRVTVLSCDRGFDATFPALASDLILTDVTVARLPAWLAGVDQNYPPYQHASCDLDVNFPGRFNRLASAPDMPFRDLFFPAPSASWLLQGAEAATGSACTAGFPASQGCLVMARASRAGATDGRCTSATLTVGGLVVGQDYVVDLDWYASAPPAGGFQAMDVYLMDAPASLGIGDVSVSEGNAGTSNAVFTVKLSPTIGQALTVPWSTASATAVAPADYQSSSGTLTFAANATTATLSVPVVGDTLVEGNETFLVNLGTPSLGTVERLDSQAVGTIVDDDLPQVSISGTTVVERDGPGLVASLPVVLDQASPTTVTVPWSSANGTATSPSDFTAASGTFTFAPGQTAKTVQVAIMGDLVPEPSESFSVNLGTPTGATLAASAGVVTIRDDDPAPVDFGLDGKSDVVVYRAGAWLPFDYASGAALTGVFTGQPQSSCIPAPADFDGDGRAEFSQLCGDKWYFYSPSGTLLKTITSTGGDGSDLPVPADYDGDGKDDVVMYRAGPPQWAGAWLFFSYQTGQQVNGIFTGHPPTFNGGTPVPYPGDFDGDGKADFSIYAGGPWHFYNADGTYKKGIWTGSIAGDIPVAGDYDGDGIDDVVVWRAGAWLRFDYASGLYQPAASVFTGAPPHATGGVPLPAPLDVDGDGILDLAVYSGGPWHFYTPAGAYLKGIWCGAVAGDRPLSRRPLP
jgi:hypothetical protein